MRAFTCRCRKTRPVTRSSKSEGAARGGAGDTITIRSFEQQDAAAQLRLPQDGGNIIIDQGMEAYSGYRCLERNALPA